MPAISALTLKDGQSTPANHVFAPKGSQMANGKNVASWRDNSQALMSDKWTLEEQHAAGNSKVPEKYRYVLKLPKSYTEPVTGKTSNPYYMGAEVIFYLPAAATDAEVADLVAITESLVTNAVVKATVKAREISW